MFNSTFIIQWTHLDPYFEKFNCVQKNDNKTAVNCWIMKQFFEYEYREISVCQLFLSSQSELDPYFSYSLWRLPNVEKTPSATVATAFEYKSLQMFQ